MASLILLQAGSAQAGAANLYYERSVAVAAQSKCRLFEPRLAAALSAATLQARGAALRSGVEATALAATSARARSRVASVPCADADLRTMASRVEAGFAGWSRAARITFPGSRSDWRGDRFASTSEAWRLVQDGAASGAPVRIGLVGRSPLDTRLAAVVSFDGAGRPYAARLLIRNAQVMPRPWLVGDGLPPENARASYFATGVRAAEAGVLSVGQRRGDQWAFPQSAADALARLDPRETFRIEFLFRDDSVSVAQFEVGDFAAGRAFLAMGPL
ncbi:hypothetical protein [Brevundimonas vesicularis]|uniref:hypothetical protein n=1 Tax=Brevundimonas vesicularis TaxID=41276 RepID=UPI0038D42CA5